MTKESTQQKKLPQILIGATSALLMSRQFKTNNQRNMFYIIVKATTLEEVQ